MSRRIISAVSLALALLLCGDALAYDFEVSARTEAYAYQLRRYDRDGLIFLNRRRLTQYLGIRIFNLLDPGQSAYKPGTRRPPALLYAHGLMRFFSDFGDFSRPREPIHELRDNRFDLMIGAIEGRNLWGYVDFTLGRQYDSDLLDFFAYDGLRVRLNSPWKLYAESYFGIQVDRSRPFSAAVFETDGTSGESTDDDALGPTFGVAVGVDDLYGFDLRVAYRSVASRSDVVIDDSGAEQSMWGLDQELVYAGASYLVPLIRLRLGGALRLDMLTGQVDELQASVTQMLARRHRIELELLQSRPHFDGDSIFNLFTIEPYTELAGRYSLRLLDRLLLEGRLGYRWFFSDEEEELEPGALSAALGASWRARRLGADLVLFYLDGLTGRRGGGDLGGRWISPRWFFGRRITLEGRLSVVRSSEDDGRTDPLTTFGLQLGAELRFLPGVRFHLLLEDNINRLYDSALRVFAVLDMSFAP